MYPISMEIDVKNAKDFGRRPCTCNRVKKGLLSTIFKSIRGLIYLTYLAQGTHKSNSSLEEFNLQI